MSQPASKSNGPVDALLARWMDDQLSDAEWLQLRDLLANDEAALDRYLDCAQLHALLEVELGWQGAIRNYGIDVFEDVDPLAKVRTLSDAMILPAIRITDEKEERDPLEDLLPPPSASVPLQPPQNRFFQRRQLSSLLRWRAAAVLLLLLGGIIAALGILHHGSPAATLVASVDAEWGQETHARGDVFTSGTTSQLTSGFAELHFSGGATVVVEGPAEITMRSDREMFVSSGKIFATVPGGGFVVSTQSATITDLGTEFGVSVPTSDQCQVAVFKGKVQVDAKASSQDGTAPPGAPASTILTEGQAVSVSAAGTTASPSSAISQQFTRTLESPVDSLDMVDLVAGGDGTTHLRGLGIDANGNWGKLAPTQGVQSDGVYHRVPGLAAVDGVFIPKGTVPTQLDSAGDSFAFPGVLGVSHNQIFTGPPIPQPPSPKRIQPTLAGVDYSAPSHGLLIMCSARGLTFDLNAIRRLHPDRRISTFHCMIGNLYQGPLDVKADAWVLVDGRQQFFAHNFGNFEKPRSVSVSITDSDHYLTLATGYPPAAGHNYMWVVAADPVLALEPR